MPGKTLWSICESGTVADLEDHIDKSKAGMLTTESEIRASHGYSILHNCVLKQRHEVLGCLLDKLKSVDPNMAQEHNMVTALHLAVKKDSPRCGCLLLYHRWKLINMFIASLSDETAYHLASEQNKILFLLPMRIVDVLQAVLKLQNIDRFRARRAELDNSTQREDDMKQIKLWMAKVARMADENDAQCQRPPSVSVETCQEILKMCRLLLLELCRLCLDKDLRRLLKKVLVAGLNESNFKTLLVEKCQQDTRYPTAMAVPEDDNEFPVLNSSTGLGRKPWIEQCILLTALVYMARYSSPEELMWILHKDDVPGAAQGQRHTHRWYKKFVKEWRELARTYKEDLPGNVSIALQMVLEDPQARPGNSSNAAILLYFCAHTQSDMTRSLDWSELELEVGRLEEAMRTVPDDTIMMRHVDWIRSNVDEIDLSKNKLTAVPSLIFDFRSLISLDLSGNPFDPLDLNLRIFQIPHLIMLNLTSCGLSELPEDLIISETLQELILKKNGLSSLPLSVWSSNITHLDLAYNKFCQLPEAAGMMNHLVKLILAGNTELNSLPQSLSFLDVSLDLDLTKLWAYSGERRLWYPYLSSLSSSGYNRKKQPVGAVVVYAASLQDGETVARLVQERSRALRGGNTVVVLREQRVDQVLCKARLIFNWWNKHIIVRDEGDDGEEYVTKIEAAINRNCSANHKPIVGIATKPFSFHTTLTRIGSDQSRQSWRAMPGPEDIVEALLAPESTTDTSVPILFTKVLQAVGKDPQEASSAGVSFALFETDERFRQRCAAANGPFSGDDTVKNEEYFNQLYAYLHKCCAAIRLSGLAGTCPDIVCTNLPRLCAILNQVTCSRAVALADGEDVDEDNPEVVGRPASLCDIVATLREEAAAAGSQLDPYTILLSLMQALQLAFVLPNQSLFLPLSLREFPGDQPGLWPDPDNVHTMRYPMRQTVGEQRARPQFLQFGHHLTATILAQLPELWRLSVQGDESAADDAPAASCWLNRLAVTRSTNRDFVFGMCFHQEEHVGQIELLAAGNAKQVLGLLDDLLWQVWQQHQHNLDYSPNFKLHLRRPALDTADLRSYYDVRVAEVHPTDFSDYELLGRGSYGEVYRFVYDENDCAAKLFLAQGDLQPFEEMRKELFILRLTRDCQFTLNLVAVALNANTIILELAKEGTLDKHLKPNHLLNRSTLQCVAMQMFAAVACLHRRGILHLDITPRNFFVISISTTEPEKVLVKLGDFGTSAASAFDHRQQPDGTQAYMPPTERLYPHQRIATPAKDVYCLAITLLEQLGGEAVVKFLYRHARDKPNLTRDQRYSDTAVMHMALLRQATKNHCGLFAYIHLAGVAMSADVICRPLAQAGLAFACSLTSQLLVSMVTAEETDNPGLLNDIAVVLDRSTTGYTPHGLLMLKEGATFVRVPLSNREKVSYKMAINCREDETPTQAWKYRNRPMAAQQLADELAGPALFSSSSFSTSHGRASAVLSTPQTAPRPRPQGVLVVFRQPRGYRVCTGRVHDDGLRIDIDGMEEGGMDGQPVCMYQTSHGYIFFGLASSKVVVYRVVEQGLVIELTLPLTTRSHARPWKVEEILVQHLDDTGRVVVWLVQEGPASRELLVWDLNLSVDSPIQDVRMDYSWNTRREGAGQYIKLALSNNEERLKVWVCSGLKAFALPVVKNGGQRVGEVDLSEHYQHAAGANGGGGRPAVEITAALCFQGVLYVGMSDGCIHLIQDGEERTSHLCTLQAHRGEVYRLEQTVRVLDIRDLVDSERRVMRRELEPENEKPVVVSIGLGSGLLPNSSPATCPLPATGVPLLRSCQTSHRDCFSVDASPLEALNAEYPEMGDSLQQLQDIPAEWQTLQGRHKHGTCPPGLVIATWEAQSAEVIRRKSQMRDWVLDQQ